MELEYIIKYKIGNDIPINPAWIRDQIRAALVELQTKINKKNLNGQHIIELQAPEGWRN
jgi:hypothetical protein